ncbi:MAG: sugar phosphate isomerase/epimerase [Armatimonadetes bacterium]|jgi:sugar phosphate isomerase/epimerase|nr:sugar phosphate isomerase/epimerase [Armatimonadota bacterium]
MFQPKLGVSLHTVGKAPTEALLQALAESRVSTLELFPTLFEGEDAANAKAALQAVLRRHEIRVATIHAPFGGHYDPSLLEEGARREAVAALAPAFALAAEFDAPMVVLHASAEPITPEERPRRLAQARASLAEIGRWCQESGRRVAVELLPRSCLGNTVDELLALLEGLPEETFGVCLDTNHGMAQYARLADDIRRLGPRLITTHLSDYDGVDEKHWLPGRGVVDWRAVMAALQEIGYTGPMNYESLLDGEAPSERLRSLESNFAWLCSLLP